MTTDDLCPPLRALQRIADRHGGWTVIDLGHTLPDARSLECSETQARAWTIREAGIDLSVAVGYGRSLRTGKWGLLRPAGTGPVILDAEDDTGATVTGTLASVRLLRSVLGEPYDWLHGDLNGDTTGAEWLAHHGVRCRHSGITERALVEDGATVEWCLGCGDQWRVEVPA